MRTARRFAARVVITVASWVVIAYLEKTRLTRRRVRARRVAQCSICFVTIGADAIYCTDCELARREARAMYHGSAR